MKRNALTPLADRGLAAPALRAKLALGNRLQSSMFCAPRGLLGRLGGGLMAMDRETGAWVLGLLAIGGSDAVLEIGSGPWRWSGAGRQDTPLSRENRRRRLVPDHG